MSSRIDRRSCLRGMGVSVALPLLEAMLRPGRARAQARKPRLIFNVWPNGLPWIPSVPGTPNTYRPVSNVYNKYAVDAFLNGLAPEIRQVCAAVARTDRRFGGGLYQVGGGHAAWAGILSAGVNKPYFEGGYTEDPGYKLMRETVDQRIARALGLKTLSAAMSRAHGEIQHQPPLGFENLSWRRRADGLVEPVIAHRQPRAMFDLITGSQAASLSPEERQVRRQLLERKHRVLDAVNGQIKALRPRLGTSDRQRLDEYLTGIDDLDMRTRAETALLGQPPDAPTLCAPTMPRPMDGFSDHSYSATTGRQLLTKYQLFTDLMIRAMECDLYQVFTFQNGTTNNQMDVSDLFPMPDVPSNERYWHSLSHWGAIGSGAGGASGSLATAKKAAYRGVVLRQIELFNGFVKKLFERKQADGRRLLDDTVAVLTTEMGEGYGHTRNEAPVFMVGTAGNRLPPHQGRVFAIEQNVPLADVWLTLLNRFGISETRFGYDGANATLL